MNRRTLLASAIAAAVAPLLPKERLTFKGIPIEWDDPLDEHVSIIAFDPARNGDHSVLSWWRQNSGVLELQRVEYDIERMESTWQRALRGGDTPQFFRVTDTTLAELGFPV